MDGASDARFVSGQGYDVYRYVLTDTSKGPCRLTGAQLQRESGQERSEAGADSDLNEEHANIIMSGEPYAAYEARHYRRMAALEAASCVPFEFQAVTR